MPRAAPSTHERAEARSLALHRAVAARLRADPALLDRARARVRRWATERPGPGDYVAAWERILSLDLESICGVLVSSDPEATALRQVSPFAGVLEPRERWRVLREVEAS